MDHGPDYGMTSALAAVCAELAQREPIFHREEPGTSRAELERMTAPEFWEIGASGRRYSREHVIATLEQRYADAAPDRWQAEGFFCQELATDLYLLTYTLKQDARQTRRATIWRRVAQGWVVVFHQGTVIAP